MPGERSARLAQHALLFEEFLARERQSGTLDWSVPAAPGKRALVHGHCHQKAFGAMGAMRSALQLVPALELEMIESGCCGMAGGVRV